MPLSYTDVAEINQEEKKTMGKTKKEGFTLKTAILSFQHMFAMFGATILVPILTGMSISVALLSAGLATIAFYFIAQKKVPVFLGSSFAFLPALISGMQGAGEIGSDTWNRAMGKVSVAVMLAGLVYGEYKGRAASTCQIQKGIHRICGSGCLCCNRCRGFWR
jgi:xanthine/uracil permease